MTKVLGDGLGTQGKCKSKCKDKCKVLGFRFCKTCTRRFGRVQRTGTTNGAILQDRPRILKSKSETTMGVRRSEGEKSETCPVGPRENAAAASCVLEAY